MAATSDRIAKAVAALPLRPGMRVLEIGCGPGAAARLVLSRIGATGVVLGIDRSAAAVAQAVRSSSDEIATGRLEFRIAAVESFVLNHRDEPFDLAFALRVGALDGRHPSIGEPALARIAAALRPEGKLFVDTGNPLQQVEFRRPA